MKKYIADTYAWIAYFEKNEAYRHIVENPENLFTTPAPVCSELARVLRKKGLGKEDADKLLEFVRDRSVIAPFGYEEAVAAGETSWREKMPLVDAMVYAHGSQNEKIITGDEHFRGKPNVEFMK